MAKKWRTLYYLESAPCRRTGGLEKYLARYAIQAHLFAYDVMSDGSSTAGLYPWATCLGIGGGGLAGGMLGAFVGGVTGALVDYMFGRRGKEQPAPAPILAVVEVGWRNVRAGRQKWAEYLLCVWAARNGWEIRHTDGILIDPRNAGYARRAKAAPRPWSDW